MAPKSKPPPIPIVSALSASERVEVSAHVDSPYRTASSGRVKLSAAINSVAAFQIVLSSPQSALTGVEFVSQPFTRQSEAGHSSAEPPRPSPPRFPVTLYRLFPVKIDRCPTWYLRSIGPDPGHEFLDALVVVTAPRNGQPYTITAGGQLPIWVEIKIPQDAAPGPYQSAITIRGRSGELARVPIDLVVRDVSLPIANTLPVLAGVQLAPILAEHTKNDPNNIRAALTNPDARRVLSAAFQQLHDHGLSPYTDGIRPGLAQDIDGSVKIDWSQYDTFCQPMIDGSAYDDRRPARGWPLPIDLQQPDPIQYDGLQSPAYAAILTRYLAAVREHFQAKGWLERAWIWFDLASGPQPSPEEVAQFRSIAALLHGSSSATTEPAVQRATLVSTLIPQSMTPFGWVDFRHDDVSAIVDIWATPARYHHHPTMIQQQAAGKRIWLSPGQPPYAASLAVEAPPVHARSLAWQAFLQGSDAVIIRNATKWPEKIFDQEIRGPSTDSWLLYPGAMFGLPEPIPSLRLKQLQLGLQDYELLHMLNEHDHGETARLIGSSLIQACGTEAYGDNYLDGLFGRRIDDPRAWQLAHEILLEEAAAAVAERPVLNQAANRALWAKFLSETRRIEVTPESTRVTLSHRASGGAESGHPRPRRILTVTHDIAVRSELRTDVRGTLQLGGMSPGSTGIKDNVPVGPIGETGVARKPLAWELDGPLPCDLDGHFSQPIRFDAAAAGEVQADAVLSIAQAPRASKPIIIDGDLAEWLPSEFNAAGDFRLITQATASSSSSQSPGGASAAHRPSASSQTIAYFCRDSTALYVAIHAASPKGKSGQAKPVKITGDIEYEDLAPVGEDLVEILLDPTNRGTLSDDLYHVVIKANGIGVFERGIGMTPPIGRREPWPEPPPRHAVVRTDYGWSAEIAIPLAALGMPGRGSVWGLNIARAEPVRGEYSDWSRAPRYCYDPRTLGNLLWQE